LFWREIEDITKPRVWFLFEEGKEGDTQQRTVKNQKNKRHLFVLISFWLLWESDGRERERMILIWWVVSCFPCILYDQI